MNPKALKSLEYYKIIDQLTEKASSQMGKDLCRHLLPSEDVYEIRHMQTQTRDALTRLFQKGNISFGSVKDVRGSLKRLEIEVSGSPRNMFGPFHQSYTGCSRISWADFRTEGMFHTDGKVLEPYGMMGQSYICEYEEQ